MMMQILKRLSFLFACAVLVACSGSGTATQEDVALEKSNDMPRQDIEAAIYRERDVQPAVAAPRAQSASARAPEPVVDAEAERRIAEANAAAIKRREDAENAMRAKLARMSEEWSRNGQERAFEIDVRDEPAQ
ncbi:MAG: hypothetical protein AAF610_06730 [Pseudomonadota bacterium]